MKLLFGFVLTFVMSASGQVDLAHYRTSIPDPDEKKIETILNRMSANSSSRRGGNISGGGGDYWPLTAKQAREDGPRLQTFQLSLLGNPPKAFHKEHGQKKIRVAVVDSGLQLGSRAASRVVHFQDFTGTCQKLEDCKGSVHGTFVSDLILQTAPAAELVILRANSDLGGGTFPHLLQSLKWIQKNHQEYHIKVVNMSLVTPEQMSGLWNEADEARTLIKELDAAGVFVISPAGNGFQKYVSLFPASTPESITVGSYSHFFSENSQLYRPSSFSDQGYANKPETHRQQFLFFESISRNFNAWIFKPDLLAPGERLFACLSEKCFLVSDTSFAAALISGAVYRLIESKPELTRGEFLEKVRKPCTTPFLYGEFDRSVACAFKYENFQ